MQLLDETYGPNVKDIKEVHNAHCTVRIAPFIDIFQSSAIRP